MFLLLCAAGGHLHRSIRLDNWPIESIRIGWLQDGTLRLGESFIHLGWPTMAWFMTKVRSSVDACGRCKSIQTCSTLPIGRPSHGTVYRTLREQDDISCFRDRLTNKFVVHFSVSHAWWHFKIRFVRTRNDTETAISSIMIRQQHITAQQCRADGPLLTVICQKGIVFSRSTIDVPPWS